MKKSLGAITYADPAPLWLIATYTKDGKPNMMAAGAGAIGNMRPPCMMIALRPATLTHGTILERKSFTINIVDEAHWREADYAGMTTGRRTNKFMDTGLTPVRSTLVDAPIIEECPVNYECRLFEKVDLPSHTVFFGEVLDVKIDESVFDRDSGPDVRKIKPVIFSPRFTWKSSGYYSVGERISDAYTQKKPTKHMD